MSDREIIIEGVVVDTSHLKVDVEDLLFELCPTIMVNHVHRYKGSEFILKKIPFDQIQQYVEKYKDVLG